MMSLWKYSRAALPCAVLFFSPQIGGAQQPGPTALETQIAEPAAGTWMMNYANVQGKGTVVLASLPNAAPYRICRNRLNGTGNPELYVYVDDRPLRSNGVGISGLKKGGPGAPGPLNNFSLDEGSCVIAVGKKFALRYAGTTIDINSSLHGNYNRLSGTLTPADFTPVSTWAMTFSSQGGPQFHDVVLVDGVNGTYRVCIKTAEVQPALGYTNLGIEVDGVLVNFAGTEVPARFGTCTDVSGSKVVMRQLSWSPGLNYYIVSGSLSLLTASP